MVINKLENIPIQEIDDQDRTYAISTSPAAVDTLVASIKRVGLINPIMVQKRKDGNYRIVIGFRRFEALKVLKQPQVPALIADENSRDLDLFEQAIYDRVSTRPLNPVELSTVIQKLEKEFGVAKSEIVQKYFPIMGYGRNPKVYDLYARLITLNPAWQKAVINEEVSIDIANIMIEISDSIRNEFLNLIKLLRLGKNQQRAFWALLSDVARIQEKTVSDLLASPNFKAVLSDEKLTPSQKAERFKHELYRLRYPRYSRTKEAFDALIKEARMPQGMILKAPPYFEGEDFFLGFNFRSEDDFEEKVSFLKSLQQKQVIRKIIDLNS